MTVSWVSDTGEKSHVGATWRCFITLHVVKEDPDVETGSFTGREETPVRAGGYRSRRRKQTDLLPPRLMTALDERFRNPHDPSVPSVSF